MTSLVRLRISSLLSAADEAPDAFLYPARVPSLNDAELDALVAEAVVDC
jgi:hypothetical protein